MKKRIVIIMGIILLLIFASGITYSIFNSEAFLNTPNQKIAEFIFNAESLTNIELPIPEMKPGDEENYLFEVTNSNSEKYSKVTISYQIIIKTYHFIPFVIELYKVNDQEEVLVSVCDESFSRNEQNELVCNMPIDNLNHTAAEKHSYKLHIKFPEEYNDESYSGLVDYLNLEIKSWQNIKEQGE